MGLNAGFKLWKQIILNFGETILACTPPDTHTARTPAVPGHGSTNLPSQPRARRSLRGHTPLEKEESASRCGAQSKGVPAPSPSSSVPKRVPSDAPRPALSCSDFSPSPAGRGWPGCFILPGFMVWVSANFQRSLQRSSCNGAVLQGAAGFLCSPNHCFCLMFLCSPEISYFWLKAFTADFCARAPGAFLGRGTAAWCI